MEEKSKILQVKHVVNSCGSHQEVSMMNTGNVHSGSEFTLCANEVILVKIKKIMLIMLMFCSMTIFIILGFFSFKNRVVAKVNGEKIYSEDVDNIYLQLDDSYTKTDVLTALIDEFVVVSRATDLGIEITDEDLETALEEYKITLPDIYEKGIEIYGETEFIEGFKMQLIYNEIYEEIVEQTLQKEEDKLFDEFYQSIKLQNEMPDEMSKDEFWEEYQLDFYDYVFDCWLSVQREEAEIEILEW